MAHYSRMLNMPFEEAARQVANKLKQHGFGIITTIDLQNTFKEKLKVDFRKYRILGACNPQFAYQAISLESHLGMMLPCNVVIQEHENGRIEISAVNPLDNLGTAASTPQLIALAEEVGANLRTALDEV